MSSINQFGLKPTFRKSFGNYGNVVIAAAFNVNLGTKCGVERKYNSIPMLLLSCNDDSNRSPCPLHQVNILLGKFATVIQYCKRHDMKASCHRSNLLNFKHPTRSNPRPWANGVKPEISNFTRFTHSQTLVPRCQRSRLGVRMGRRIKRRHLCQAQISRGLKRKNVRIWFQ